MKTFNSCPVFNSTNRRHEIDHYPIKRVFTYMCNTSSSNLLSSALNYDHLASGYINCNCGYKKVLDYLKLTIKAQVLKSRIEKDI